jgi:hypothetical protein
MNPEEIQTEEQLKEYILSKAMEDGREYLFDPWFYTCLDYELGSDTLMKEFDRLQGSTLFSGSILDREVDKDTGKFREDLIAFVEFVKDAIYMRTRGLNKEEPNE